MYDKIKTPLIKLKSSTLGITILTNRKYPYFSCEETCFVYFIEWYQIQVFF